MVLVVVIKALMAMYYSLTSIDVGEEGCPFSHGDSLAAINLEELRLRLRDMLKQSTFHAKENGGLCRLPPVMSEQDRYVDVAMQPDHEIRA